MGQQAIVLACWCAETATCYIQQPTAATYLLKLDLLAISCILLPLQEPLLEALAVALQHPAVADCVPNVCTLLQGSKAWRAVAQQSTAGLAWLDFSGYSIRQLGKFSSFTNWLAKYPGLIGALNIKFDLSDNLGAASTAALLQAIQQLAEFGLQTAAAASGSCAPLRMSSYSSSIPPTAGLLAALPAATLTSLQLDRAGSDNWYPALSKLTNLRSISLVMMNLETAMVDRCLQQLGTLKKLTTLTLVSAGGDMQMLPVQLESLCLYYIDQGPSTLLDLQHLVKLQQLTVFGQADLAEGSSLPQYLQSMQLDAAMPLGGLVGLHNLHQVTTLHIRTRRIKGEHLKKLENSAQLRELSLELLSREILVDVAAAWHCVPLCELEISVDSLTAVELQQVVQHISAATQLTRLYISVLSIMDVLEPHSISICEYCRSLSKLESLHLSTDTRSNFAKQDAEHLSALVKLTELRLSYGGAGPYLDPTDVCLLAVTLTNLRVLVINESDALDAAGGCINVSVLPAIGRLSKLERLHLECLERDVALRGLSLLTGLSSLYELEGFDRAGDEALDVFWHKIMSQQ